MNLLKSGANIHLSVNCLISFAWVATCNHLLLLHVKKKCLTSVAANSWLQPGHLRLRESRLRLMQGSQNMCQHFVMITFFCRSWHTLQLRSVRSVLSSPAINLPEPPASSSLRIFSSFDESAWIQTKISHVKGERPQAPL